MMCLSKIKFKSLSRQFPEPYGLIMFVFLLLLNSNLSNGYFGSKTEFHTIVKVVDSIGSKPIETYVEFF